MPSKHNIPYFCKNFKKKNLPGLILVSVICIFPTSGHKNSNFNSPKINQNFWIKSLFTGNINPLFYANDNDNPSAIITNFAIRILFIFQNQITQKKRREENIK